MPKTFYSQLPDRCFWKPSVASATGDQFLAEIHKPRWRISRGARIATAGSCFAQNISRFLKANTNHFIDMEPAPPGLSPDLHSRFGYNLYSARYGNIYTSRHLLQIAKQALLGTYLDESLLSWVQEPFNGQFFRDLKYVDALRPGISGRYSKPAELLEDRLRHLEAVRSCLINSDVFIFTLGLIELWEDSESGLAYQTAPHALASPSANKEITLKILNFNDVIEDLESFLDLVNAHRTTDMKLILTVSPVPLTATATEMHVLQANTYSKSLLRTAAQQMALNHPNVDYFPSFEIVFNPKFIHESFLANLRSINPSRVNQIMNVFADSYLDLPNSGNSSILPKESLGDQDPANIKKDDKLSNKDFEDICEEMLLELERKEAN